MTTIIGSNTSTSSSSYSNTPITSSQSSTQSSCTVPAGGSGNITIIETAGQLPCGCVLVDSNGSGSLYVSTNSKVGNYVCITGSLNNSPEVYLSVANSTGSIVFSPPACIAGGLWGDLRETHARPIGIHLNQARRETRLNRESIVLWPVIVKVLRSFWKRTSRSPKWSLSPVQVGVLKQHTSIVSCLTHPTILTNPQTPNEQ